MNTENGNLEMTGLIRVTQCRICKGSDLMSFLDLGNQPPANSFLRKEDLEKPEPMYPLRIAYCRTCGLSQLLELVDPELLFRDYVYFSNVMPSSPHFRAYAEKVVKQFASSPNDLVVEIGSNDGHVLSVIKEMGPRILGVDPARNIAAIANTNGVETIPEFFTKAIGQRIYKEKGHASLIIANNVVAHTDNHHDLAAGIEALLAPNGVFVLEAPHLLDMFDNLAFDTTYHEHMSYLSLRPLVYLFEKIGMQVFDVEMTAAQGNSLRLYACRRGMRNVKPSVQEMLDREHATGLDNEDAYRELARRIAALKAEVVSVVTDLKKQGKKIAAYGAPAKGNTLLNYFGLDADILDYATEELPSKIGFYTPGTHIPVMDINWAHQNPPDYYLMLAWNYKNVILQKEDMFRKNGGKFIIPIGSERIV